MAHHYYAGQRLVEAIPAITNRYQQSLKEAANPLGTTPELWEESRAHASMMLEACAHAIELPDANPRDNVHHGEYLLFCSAMGTLWACCRARLTDSLSAMETLVRITFDTVIDLVAHLPDPARAALIARAARVVNQIAALHTQAAALSYDAYLLQQIEQANANDRNRLARDIHDRLGNSLVLASRHVELHQIKAAVGDGIVGEEHLSAIQTALAEATAYTRSLISGLRAEAPLTNLEQALVSCANDFNFDKLPVHIAVHGDETWLPEHYRDELFLILREFLRNSFAHAQPGVISVQVGISPHRVDVEAYDDGLGFVPEADPAVAARQRVTGAPSRRRGAGLVVMRERTEQLGGQFALLSAPGNGTHLRVWAPLPKREQEPGPVADRDLIVAAVADSPWQTSDL
jgi:signal transduction histidine kinase